MPDTEQAASPARHLENGPAREVAPRRAVAVVRLHGVLDATSAPAARADLTRALSHGATDVVVDAAALEFVDPPMLGVLVVAARRAAAQGGSLVVDPVSRPVRRALEAGGLGGLLRPEHAHRSAVA